MSRYAERTAVPVERSKAEIERILGRYGAHEFGYAIKGKMAAIMFSANGKHLRFILPLPLEGEYNRTPTGKVRGRGVMQEALATETRRRWRSLALNIKAKLDSVDTGIEVFEQAFLAQIVLPDGHTVGEHVIPKVEEAYLTGKIRGVAGLIPEFTEVTS